MKKQIANQTDLVPMPYKETLPQRRKLFGRFFQSENGTDNYALQRLNDEHAIARHGIQIEADLARCRRQAGIYLELSKLEDMAVKEIAKKQKLDDLLEQVDELYAHDPMTALVLKAKIKEIYRGSNHGSNHKRPGR